MKKVVWALLRIYPVALSPPLSSPHINTSRFGLSRECENPFALSFLHLLAAYDVLMMMITNIKSQR